MTNYLAYGVVLASTTPLPHLPPGPSGDSTLVVSHDPRAVDERGWCWRDRTLDESDRVWLAIGKRNGSFRLRFEDGGDFVVSAEGRRIDVHGAQPSDDLVAHLLLDQVIPLALSQTRRFVLHASAVVTPAGAVAFTGPAGAGKSTLAAALGAAGCPVISDDALVIEQREGTWHAVPAYPGARLWPDVVQALPIRRRLPRVARYTKKRRVGPDDGVAFSAQPAPLQRLYVLQPATAGGRAGAAAISPATRREGAMALVSHTYLLDVDDPGSIRAQFARATDACGDLVIRILTFRHSLKGLGKLGAAVMADLQ